ncbi:aspartate aminotransferase family protein [Paenarthrobacter histidinolovorans]|uniref:aspartate aminotransferase family protein n=1 Tax=Paenarthrobacter histidinolovorans TaxID=43664 RepID=UPI001665FA82|nr:aminotransferase class III-fold pyridoxal phosphate-dependent enzyme [Paenarthrobacter histidinolovorans]GGJ22022.1 aspartate aminotransferase family protein [Paenarthrobacter histidinolovorans]
MVSAKCFEGLVREFQGRTHRSRKVAERARRVLPGGETRSITYYSPYPVSITSASGPVITDCDGNSYLDILNNYTSLVHGHAFGPVVATAIAAAREGIVYPAPHEAQLDLAEHLSERHPTAEKVRFTNSGTEAALLAIRIAQAVTGRDRFVLFEGGYHGSAPLISGPHSQVIRVPFNDGAAVEEALDDSIAAVLFEPCLGVGGVIPADPGFVRTLRSQTHRVGALLITDEVQTLRASYGGATEVYGLEADLVIMAKLIGGGYPIGAVGGPAKHLRILDQSAPGAITHSGTFNGHLVSARAGLTALEHLSRSAIGNMNASTEKLADRIEMSGRAHGLPVIVTRFGSMMHVHLQEMKPTQAAHVTPNSTDTAALHLALLLEGIFAAPRGLVALSTVLTDVHLESIATGYDRAFARMAAG